jgi:hypothetical protein
VTCLIFLKVLNNLFTDFTITFQAIRNNMADVSAKDGSQETFVNLCASLVGIVILSTFNEGE